MDQSARRRQTPAPPGSATVLALGADPGALEDEGAAVESLAGEVEREHGPALVELLGTALGSVGTVLTISPVWFAPAARLRVEMADAALDRSRVAIHETALPPLAAGVLAALAGALAPRIPEPGLLHAALGPLEARLHWFGWLGSVRGLEQPSPSVIDHLTSFVPGTEYAVSSWPEPAVRRLTGKDRSVALPALEGPHALVVAAQRRGSTEWVQANLAPALGLEGRVAAPSPHGASWWGTDRVVEAVVHPTALDPLAATLVAGLPARECTWCARSVAADPCPLCGFDAGAPRAA